MMQECKNASNGVEVTATERKRQNEGSEGDRTSECRSSASARENSAAQNSTENDQSTAQNRDVAEQNAQISKGMQGILPLSKKQQKKELKRQRYLEKRQEKRILEKARKKAKRDEIRKTGGDLAPRRGPITLMSESTCEQRIAIDLCYESKMNERQIKSIITQLSFCYAANRRVRNPSQLYFLSFGGVTRGMFNSNPTYSNWDIHFETKSLCEVFKKDDIVYLTADSENILGNLDSSRVYVIGGLLDHNSLKGYCLNEANEMGVAHARLPIDDFVRMKTRKVLTIDQVFQILLRYIETKSWKEAFFKVIPKRRLADEEINGGSSDQGEIGDPDCKRGRKDDENGESQTERGIEKDSVVGVDRGGSDMKSVTNGNGNGENSTGEKLEEESAGEDRRGADVTTVGEDNEDGERLSEKTVRERIAEEGQGEKD